MARIVDLKHIESIVSNDVVMLVLEPLSKDLSRKYGIGLFQILDALEDKKVLDVIKKSIKKR